jgi:hypothetical protein
MYPRSMLQFERHRFLQIPAISRGIEDPVIFTSNSKFSHLLSVVNYIVS